ncbi:hypothetical protein MMC18_009005 [Xylographa bjoerkii]|nr:hypothetical protein [Xylographa bjoerkii]
MLAHLVHTYLLSAAQAKLFDSDILRGVSLSISFSHSSELDNSAEYQVFHLITGGYRDGQKFPFQQGKCTYGDRCQYSHDNTTILTTRDGNSRNKAFCRNFVAGKCSYGSKCRFSHDIKSDHDGGSAAAQGKTINTRRSAPPENTELLFWRRKLGRPGEKETRPFFEGELFDFCETALTLMCLRESDPRHQIIMSLADETGLVRIREVMELQFGRHTLEKATELFTRATLPILQVITHKEVLSSLVLEASRGTIFNVMYGIQGRRAVAFYEGLIKLLQQIAAIGLVDKETLSLSLSASLTVLSQIIECNQTANLVEEFQGFLKDFTNLLNQVSSKSTNSLRAQDAARQLTRIRNRLEIGATITTATEDPVLPMASLCFEIGVDGPGRLSAQGPRHDNDHEDICKIQIMPTVGEIRSARLEYLPTTDTTRFHVKGLKGLLDRQFRLLREDTIGQLRDCVQCVLEALITPGSEPGVNQRTAHGTRYLVYTAVVLSDVLFEMKQNRGLQIVADFNQPLPVRNMKRKEDRRRWWSETKQLQVDSLLCLVDSNGRSVFLSVSQREEVLTNTDSIDGLPGVPTGIQSSTDFSAQGLQNGQTDFHSTSNTMARNLWNDQSRCAVTLQLVDLFTHGISEIVGRSHSETAVTQVLVEFPGVLLPSFRPTLEALQAMSNNLNVPFVDMIAPTHSDHQNLVQVGPPAYALQPSFTFDLRPITRGHDLFLDPHKAFDINNLLKYSSLDEAQGAALVNALGRNLALIQGPPGTGKSYVAVQVVKVLLARREEAEMGPIICVCYTNHALDQFLEQILSQGTKKIIRLGAGSKSKVLEPFNLRNISQDTEDTKVGRQAVWQARKVLESAGKEVASLLQDLKRSTTTNFISRYLEGSYPHYASELFQTTDEDGFTTVQNERRDPIEHWLFGGMSLRRGFQNRTLGELYSRQLSTMKHEERIALHKSWITDIRESLTAELNDAIDEFVKSRDDLNRCRRDRDLRCLEQAHLIGLTTSGLARNADLLRGLAPKVLICEEAGEILEAHTVTAFLPTIEHAILIGDHEQLRPQIQNYDLSMENPRGRKYSLDVSLFERLIRHPDSNTRIPYDTLEVQRRMDPSISRLIRNTVYPKLKDHEVVEDYPSVVGMRKRLFWLDHRVPEGHGDPSQLSSTSHWSDWEVELVVALVTHLVRQGTYKNEEIAILTPYVRQLQKIRNALGTVFDIVIGDRDVEELEKQENSKLTTESMNTEIRLDTVPVMQKAALSQRLRIATIDNSRARKRTSWLSRWFEATRIDHAGF